MQLPFENGVNSVPTSPAVNEQKVVASGNALASARVKVDPDLTLAALTMFKDGNAWRGNAEPAGQEVMNEAASVKIWRAPTATSNAWAMGSWRRAVRMKVWWRDSMVTIDAAADNIFLSVTSGAAPRYLPKTLG